MTTAGVRNLRRATLRGHLDAFTLVELLVVIGIVGILIGILLPSFAAARRQSKIIQCLSQMREVTRAGMMYANDHKGRMPLAGRLNIKYRGSLVSTSVNRVANNLGDSSRELFTYTMVYGNGSPYFGLVPWNGAIAKYLAPSHPLPFENWSLIEDAMNAPNGIWKHFLCPDSGSLERGKILRSGAFVPERQGTVLEVISGLQQYGWSTNMDYVLNEGLFGWDDDTGMRRLKGRGDRIKKSSQMMIMTDGQRRKEPAAFYNVDGWQVWTPTTDAQLSRSISLAEAFVVGSAQATVMSSGQFDTARHRGKVNIAFLDGHVETRKIDPKDLTDVLVLPEP